jgi:nucleotide-binding universal stress UspA family protein
LLRHLRSSSRTYRSNVSRDIESDLVVVGHKGHFLEDYLLGSTADRVAHHAVCPVMIVK